MRTAGLLCIAFLLLAVPACAQRDSLAPVLIKKQKQPSTPDKLKIYSPGMKRIELDSQLRSRYYQQTLAQLLYQQAPVFVKSYGFNALATLSFRGASSVQSKVLWNGAPIQNAALGLADVSQLPVSLFDRISIQYGSSAALAGSGNVGGALLLETTIPHDSVRARADVALAAGSFGQRQACVRLSGDNGRVSTSLRYVHQQSENDFYFLSSANNLEPTRNAATRHDGVLFSLGYRKGRGEAYLHAWLQQYDRQIPKALFESQSFKRQQDRAVRVMAGAAHNGRVISTYLKTMVAGETGEYQDSIGTTRLRYRTEVRSGYGEAGLNAKWNRNGNLLLFVPVEVNQLARPDSALRSQERVALAGALQQQNRNRTVNAALNARLERINRQTVLLPGANLAWNAKPWMRITANVQRTYRAPTLNELYYQPGGNPALLPESGWAQDLGIAVRQETGRRWKWEQEFSFFHRLIDNWVVWFGGAVWTPHNIARVRSEGAEWTVKAAADYGTCRVTLGSSLSYISSQTVSSYQPQDSSVGRQIPYTPRWQGRVNGGLQAGRAGFYLNAVYTGLRYTTTDESQWVPAYTTLNAQLQYRLDIRKTPLWLDAQINNLLENRYEVVFGRPMPGINVLVSARIVIAR